MTTVCGGGTSSPRFGVPTLVAFTTANIVAFLEKRIDRDIANFLSSFLVGASVAVSEFCTIDPPTQPTLDATDFLNLLPSAAALDQFAAQAKVRQWFLSLYWCEICQCDNGTSVTCPTGTLPSNPIGSGTGLPQSSGGSHCWDFTDQITDPGAGGDTDITLQMLPQTTRVSVTSFGGGAPTTASTIPPGVTRIFGTYDVPANAASNGNFEATIQLYNAAGTIVTNADMFNVLNTGASGTWSITVGSTAVSWTMVTFGATNGTSWTATMSATFDCTGVNPTVLQQPCCPPDPTLQYQLNQILSLVEQLYSLIPVRVPNYAAGTSHTGLSDDGTISLDATTIAIRVTFTTIPGSIGRDFGTPDTYFGLGWVSPVTNEGVEAGLRLSRSVQVLALPEATSALDYTLGNGTIATIDELLAG